MGLIKNILLLIFMVFFAQPSFGEPVRRLYQDVKLPSQIILEKQIFSAPSTASATYILSSSAGPTSTASLTISSGFTQPDMARNLTLTPTSTTADVAGCTVAISGTNYFDASISENFVVTSSQSTATTGNKAFKTVSSVAFPANCETGTYTARWNLGIGSKLGAKRCMDDAGDLVWSKFGGTYSSTRSTAASNASSVESNTFTPNETLNGASDYTAFFVQNFGCFP